MRMVRLSGNELIALGHCLEVEVNSQEGGDSGGENPAIVALQGLIEETLGIVKRFSDTPDNICGSQLRPQFFETEHPFYLRKYETQIITMLINDGTKHLQDLCHSGNGQAVVTAMAMLDDFASMRIKLSTKCEEVL